MALARGTAWGPLMEAGLKGNADIVRRLLDAGASVEVRSANGATALHSATTASIAKVLLHAGADVNARNEVGLTPLHAACYTGSADLAETLLEAGADLEAEQASGTTPLKAAAINNRIEVVELLLARGAQVDPAFFANKAAYPDTRIAQGVRNAVNSCMQWLLPGARPLPRLAMAKFAHKRPAENGFWPIGIMTYKYSLFMPLQKVRP